MSTNQVVKGDIVLQNGTLITLTGKHTNSLSYEVPKVTARISEQIGRRISITFYQLNNQFRNKDKDNLMEMVSSGKTPFFGGHRLFQQQSPNQRKNPQNLLHGLLNLSSLGGGFNDTSMYPFQNPKKAQRPGMPQLNDK